MKEGDIITVIWHGKEVQAIVVRDDGEELVVKWQS